MDAFILSQYVLSGLVIGVIYGLMALGSPSSTAS